MSKKRFSDLHLVDPMTFRLDEVDPSDTNGLEEAAVVKDLTRQQERLADLQRRLWAESEQAVLVVLQGIDASGKDGTIRHVMSGVNPSGVRVVSFKAPSSLELDHDFLWRCQVALPRRGEIGIFNRSHYEEVIIARVHPAIVKAQQLPNGPDQDRLFWTHRFESINDWERHLERNGTRVIKFLMHISRDEQKRRFLKRIDDPKRNWKAAPEDFEERKRFDDYMRVFDEMLITTAKEHAPWYVIPADQKWYARTAVASILAETLEDMDPRYPEVTDEQRDALRAARAVLEND